MVKYILVTGGVISGIGKGIIASSTGVLLKALGLKVTAIKIDPYLNIDAGLMNPVEHGAACGVPVAAAAGAAALTGPARGGPHGGGGRRDAHVQASASCWTMAARWTRTWATTSGSWTSP